MAEFEQKNGTGTIWKNDKYQQGGTQPYAKGKIKDLNGKEFEVALWIPKSEKVKGFNFTMQEPYIKKSLTETETPTEKDDQPF